MIKNALLHKKNGQTLIMVAIFIAVFTIMSAGIVSYVIATSRSGRMLMKRAEAIYIAEAGAAKAVWCLNHDVGADCGGTAGINYPGETNISYGGGTFTTSVTTSGLNKIIVSTGTAPNGTTRSIRIEASPQPETTDVSFSFGAHIGAGGMDMGNNSVIMGAGGAVGNVYSHGDIDCGTNAAISGTVKIAGSGNKLNGCDVGYNGSGVIINNLADAWAHTFQNCRVAHDLYRPNNGSVNSCPYGRGTLGGTYYQNADLPPALPFPITSQMITDWEADALDGGTVVGDYTPANGETLGPTKIEGNLTFSENETFYIGGIVWVEGNILFENSATIRLLPTFGPNSSVIIADKPSDQANSGKITIQNSDIIEGSGDPDSYLMLIATKSGDAAIDMGNNNSGSVFVTTNGELNIGNNAILKSVVAYGLDIGNNMSLTYEIGLIDAGFTNGPGGVWKMKRETWQEL